MAIFHKYIILIGSYLIFFQFYSKGEKLKFHPIEDSIPKTLISVLEPVKQIMDSDILDETVPLTWGTTALTQYEPQVKGLQLTIAAILVIYNQYSQLRQTAGRFANEVWFFFEGQTPRVENFDGAVIEILLTGPNVHLVWFSLVLPTVEKKTVFSNKKQLLGVRITGPQEVRIWLKQEGNVPKIITSIKRDFGVNASKPRLLGH